MTQQAKRERERQQDEVLDSCTFRLLEIFGAGGFTSFESLNAAAAERRLPEAERESLRAAVEERYKSFIQRLCGPPGMGARPSDIAYDYVSHLYVLYPNVRQRTELICKCLEVLCDIVTHPGLDPYLRERQQAYFGAQQPTEGRGTESSSRRPEQGERPSAQVLATRLDFYAVEIKAKIIAIYFKFFQREEDNILGTARACLERLLNEAPHHQEALPNLILKECVRPALNVLSQPPAHSPRAFKHLAMLIEVLHVCFNDQLAQHLVSACAQRQAAVGAGYYGQSQVPPAQASDGAAGGAGSTPAGARGGAGPAGGAHLPPPGPADPATSAVERERDRERRVVAQYNLEKVGSLETVKHIIQILHLLPTPVPNSRDLMLSAIQGIPEFELRASRELETRHVPLEEGWQQRGLELRPLRVRFGVLQSDFRDGLAKFFNRNPVECVAMLRDRPAMVPLTLAIMKMPGSHTVRERIARDIDQTIRPRLRAQQRMPSRPAADDRRAPLLDNLLGVRLVWTLTKFNPSFLCQPQHGDILESLRWRWVKLSELSVDSVPPPARDDPEAITDLKNLYRKILKCLLAYCRSDRSDKQVLFDLLKGFSYQPIIDLTPLLKFFTEEVPSTFPRRRQAGIMETALNKVEASRGTHEQRYAMFEFAFMPLALACADSQERFEELFPRSTLELFVRTFFGVGHGGVEGGESVPKWKFIQMNLEPSSQVCYEQFHVELIKALSVILRRVRDAERLLACLLPREQHCRQIIAFLREFARKGIDGATREWACYALTLLCLRILDLASGKLGPTGDGQAGGPARLSELLAAEAEHCAGWVLPLMLQQSHEPACKALVGKTVSNLIKYYESRGQQPGGVSEQVRASFSAALDFEGREHQRADLCSLVVQNATILYPYHEELRSRLYELIRTSARPQSPASVERIIKAAETVTSWCQKSVREGQQRQREESLKYCKLIFGHLMDLVRGSVAQQARSLAPAELESQLTDVLRVMRTIFQIHPVGALDPPDEGRPGGAEPRDANLTLRMFELNAACLMVECGGVHRDPAMLAHALGTLSQVRSGDDAKCLLMTLKLVRTLVEKVMDPAHASEEQVRLLASRLEERLTQDLLSSSLDLDGEGLPSHERPDGQRALNAEQPLRHPHARWDPQALQAALEVSRGIPHFAVRLATCLDELASTQPAGSPTRRLREALLGYPFCKRLVSSLFKVVGRERRAIVTERPTFVRTDGAEPEEEPNAAEHAPPMVDGILDWERFEPELDRFNKVSVMAGLKFLAQRLHALPDEEAAHVFENLQWLPVALAQFKASDFVLEETAELIGILIQVEPGQERRLQAEKQHALVQRLVERLSESQERKPDRKRDTPAKVRQQIRLHNRLFESCVDFLERQGSMSTDYANRLMEHLLICSRGRSAALKQRLFTVFEKFNGQSLFKKLKFFFTAHQAEQPARVVHLFVISQLLDFTLMNFRSSTLLEKLPHSAKLHRLACPHLLIERLSLDARPEPSEHEAQLRGSLSAFAVKLGEYKQLQLSDLLDPLSEVISINPTYHDDKPLADILFTELFWQLWAILSRQEQQYLAECINKMFLSAIKHSQTLQQLLKPTTTFARTMLGSVAALSPQIRLAPELL